jgi:hypothetical protein
MPGNIDWQSAQDRQLPRVTHVNQTYEGTSKVENGFLSFVYIHAPLITIRYTPKLFS